MNYLLSAFQFACPVVVGLAISFYLRTAIRRLLLDLCGTPDRADFWVRITTVLIITAPLALVLAWGGNPLACSAADVTCPALIVRHTVAFTLAGVLLAVGILARAIGRHVPSGTKAKARAVPLEMP